MEDVNWASSFDRDSGRELGEQFMEMKLIRAPWIRCRADEAGARAYEMEWHRINFAVVAYSEVKARRLVERIERG